MPYVVLDARSTSSMRALDAIMEVIPHEAFLYRPGVVHLC
jgi:hypothetical protein